MPGLVKVKCPQCAGPLKIGGEAQQVTCEYCGHASFVRRKGEAEPRRTAQTMALGTIDLEAAERARRRLGIIVAVVVIAPIILIGVVMASIFGAVTSSVRTHLPHQSSRPQAVRKRAAAAHDNASEAISKAMARMQKMMNKHIPAAGIPIEAADLTHVDGLEIMRQALRAALKTNPHAKLSRAHFPRVVGGTVNVTKSPGYVDFGYRYQDKRKPPGEDIIKGSISVTTRAGTFMVINTGGSHSRMLPMPTCDMRTAWATAVASGVPANAIATIHYYRHGLSKRGVWSVRVKDHPEHRREIHAMTCQMVRNHARR